MTVAYIYKSILIKNTEHFQHPQDSSFPLQSIPPSALGHRQPLIDPPGELCPYYPFLVPASTFQLLAYYCSQYTSPIEVRCTVFSTSAKQMCEPQAALHLISQKDFYLELMLPRWTRLDITVTKNCLKSYLNVYIPWANAPEPSCTSKFLGT